MQGFKFVQFRKIVSNKTYRVQIFTGYHRGRGYESNFELKIYVEEIIYVQLLIELS